MADILQGLKTYYINVTREDFSFISRAHQTLLTNLSSQVDAGTLSLTAAQQQVARLTIDTTSVASLSYQFFTGAIPYEVGFDYLVSPTGLNGNSLNSPYYQNFSVENRYINFAVNLGKLGEGQTRFAAGYGSLSLSDTVTKAYTEIFGTAPDAAKVDAILNTQVANGVGGTYSRAEYFAFYGRDGLNGIGTKAALVGWLMAEAEKADIGAYAQANDAFLADLGPDDWASFHSNLVGRYGTQPAGSAGATIAFLPAQSVSPAATDPALKSTDNNDALTGTGLEQGRSLIGAGGADTVGVTGQAAGLIDAGAGNDTVTLATLGPSVGLVGGAETGTVRLGAGNDVLTVTGALSYGAVIDGGDGDDTLVAAFGPSNNQPLAISNIEHLVITGVDAASRRLDFSGPASSLNDITSQVNGDLSLTGLGERTTALRLQNVSSGAFSATYAQFGTSDVTGLPLVLVFNGPDRIQLHLDHVSVAPGASTTVTINGERQVQLHADSDSAVTSIAGPANSAILVSGVGRLTAGISEFNGLIASDSAGVDITRFGTASGGARTAVLSSHDDRIALDATNAPTANSVIFIDLRFGGADTVSLYQPDAVLRFTNLYAPDHSAVGYATVMNFVKGNDKIDLGPLVTTLSTDLAASVAGAATADQALANVSARLAANATGVFEYAGDTYIYHQDATAGVNTGDGLIKLAGVTGLTVGTGAAVVDIHYG